MSVKRIVANIETETIHEVQEFYYQMFGLEVVMNHGWIVTLASGQSASVQISLASPGRVGRSSAASFIRSRGR